ncbi:SdrD B-like domain-containing protein [Pseudidiomarina sediminum]|uniref:SdrD B-like domain-containing protein n=1 Tax=Pseudidiomarina sediminum TaxID=431675 RepID=UPI001C943991|nr:SdrD B-like domain-containing protein [Pseudidiomarina sediminum]MBY6064146.1 DUF11 domain-containing protein [Pseudidiomarina sediminum]
MVGFSAPVLADADLSLNHDLSTNSAAATETVTAEIAIDNNGRDFAENLEFSYQLPPTAEFLSINSTQGACSAPAGRGALLQCTLGGLANLARIDIEIEFRVMESTPSTVMTEATITSTTVDPDASNNTIFRNLTVRTGADLTVDVAPVGGATAVSGGPLSYQLSVENLGPDASDGIRVVSQLPNGFEATSLPVGCSLAGPQLTCQAAGALDRGATWNVGTVAGRITAASPSTLSYLASVSATTFDGIVNNNTDVADVQVTPGSDVSVALAEQPSSPHLVGEALTLIASPSYAGNIPQDLSLTIDIATQLEIQNSPSFVSNGWACTVTGQQIVCNRPSGGTTNGGTHAIGNVVVDVMASEAGIGFVNTASIRSSSPADPYLGNNDDTALVSVTPPTFDLGGKKIGPANTQRVVEQEPFNFSLLAENYSNFDFVGTVVLEDNLPDGLRLLEIVSTNGWSCTDGSGAPLSLPEEGPMVLKCSRTYTTANPLPAQSATPKVEIKTIASKAGVITNQLCMSNIPAPGTNYPDESDTSNNCDDSTVAVSVYNDSADLQVIKTADRALIQAGEALTYSLEVVNAGPDTAFNVSLSDNFTRLYTAAAANSFQGVVVTSNSATLDSCTGDGVGNPGQRLLQCVFTEVPACTAGLDCPVVDVTVMPLGNNASGTTAQVTNTANVISAATADPDYGNNSGSVTTSVESRTDVTVTKSASWTGQPADARRAGTNLTYVITAISSELSAAGASGVVIRDTLPLDVTFISATSSAGTCSAPAPGATTTAANRNLECAIGDLARGSEETVTVVVRPNLATHNTAITNLVRIDTSTPEFDLTNNTAEVTVDVAPPAVDLISSTSDTPDPIQEGDLTTYTISIRNDGPSVAEQTRIYGVLPTQPGFRFQSTTGNCSVVPNVDASGAGGVDTTAAFWRDGSWDASLQSADLICDVGLMDVGETRAIDVVFKGYQKGAYRNFFIARSEEQRIGYPDFLPANDFEVETSTVRTTADLAVTKTPSKPSVALREPFEFEIVLTNNGPGTGYGVRFTDTLPAGMTIAGAISFNDPAGAFTTTDCNVAVGATAINCPLGDIPTGAVLTMTVPVVVDSWPTNGVINNTAQVGVDDTQTYDPDETNNTSTAPVTVTRSRIDGRVYEDHNFDQQWSNGEPGINDARVRITGTDDFGNDVSRVIKTNSSGVFRINNLSPSTEGNGGGYTLTQIEPTGYLDGWETVGNAGGVIVAPQPDLATDDVISTIYLETDVNASGYHFGELRLGALAGYVFVDTNGDGVRNTNENAGLPNLSVRLIGTDYLGTAVDLSVDTGVSGAYAFTDVAPGNYRLVQETLPSGLEATGPEVGTIDGTAVGTGVAANLPNDGPEVNSIALSSNGEGVNYNFGWAGQRLSGAVYVDYNDSDLFDAGDRPLANIQITLSGNTAGGLSVCDVISPQPCTITTATDGTYSFTGIPASDNAGYSVTLQDGALGELANYGLSVVNVGVVNGNLTGAVNDRTTSGIVIATGESAENYNFGHRGSAFGGYVYYDVDRNETFDGTDQSLPNIEMTLSGRTSDGQNVCDIIDCSVLTDGNGYFSFPNLPASNGGGYTLTQTQPVDYVPGTGAPGSFGGTFDRSNKDRVIVSNVQVPRGTEAAEDYYFSQHTGDITGRVFEDSNTNNAINPGEPLLSGVEVTLSGTTASGLDVCSIAKSCTTTTDADGNYRFENVPNAGTAGYTISRVTTPADYITGAAMSGSIDGVICQSCVTTARDAITSIPFDAGSSNVAFNFSLVKPAEVSGTVYLDENGNGMRDANESIGLPNLTVELSGTDYLGDAITVVTAQTGGTAPSGSFVFKDLLPGDYTVTQRDAPMGLDFTNYQTGDAGGNGLTQGDIAITGITLASSQTATGYHFGWTGQDIDGVVYFDANQNGTFDAGTEPGIESVGVTLSGRTRDGDDVCAAIAPRSCSVQTNNEGRYHFTGIPSSDAAGYTLTQQDPATPPLDVFVNGANSVGTVGGTPSGVASANAISGIVLQTNQDGANYNFAHLGASRIAGRVFVDSNNNGIQDAGEVGLAGVEMQLAGDSAFGADVCTLVTCTVVTDSNGDFEFTGLPNNDSNGYTVTQVQPQDYTAGQNTVGDAGGTFNERNGNVELRGIDLTTEPNAANNLFAQTTNTLSGYVYVDLEKTGKRDPNDTPLSGVEITLTGTSKGGTPICDVVNSCTVTTDSNGYYEFSGLYNSDSNGYSVSRTDILGYVDSYSSGTVNGSGCTACNTSSPLEVTAIDVQGPNTYTEFNFAVDRAVANEISGVVFFDINENEARNADEGLAGVRVTLTGLNDLSQQVNFETVTDANGVYRFSELNPSHADGYIVTIEPPVGLGDFASNQAFVGTVDGAQVGTVDNANVISGVVLPLDGSGVGYNFRKKGSRIDGYVYVDADRDGVKADSEQALDAVTFRLTGEDARGETIQRELQSDQLGTFNFSGLYAGTYHIEQVQPADYTAGDNTVGTAGGSFVVTSGTVNLNDVVLAAAADGLDYGFAHNTSTISGYVYVDRNKNDQRDTEDQPLAGVEITLSGTSAGGTAICDVVSSCTVMTDADGFYSFTDLYNADANGYVLSRPEILGYVDRNASGLVNGTPCAECNTSNAKVIASIAMDASNDYSEFNFAVDRATANDINGFVYFDINEDKRLDQGESLDGITVRLTGLNDLSETVERETVTDATGAYSFTELNPSDATGYSVTIVPPAGLGDFAVEPVQIGAINGVQTGAMVDSNTMDGLVLPLDGSGIDYNFRKKGSRFEGYAYLDVNQDGVKTDNERGLDGITMVLTGEDARGESVRMETQTDALGQFSYIGLYSGTYQVEQLQPADFTAGQNSLGNQGGSYTTMGENQVLAGVQVPAGENATDYGFAHLTNSISGYVYVDVDRDSARSSKDVPLEGIVITLAGTTASGINGCDVVSSCTAVTDANGFYSFAGLYNADVNGYTLSRPAIEGYVDLYSEGLVNGAGCATCDFSNATSIQRIAVTAPNTYTEFNFAVERAAVNDISGTVYFDINEDEAIDDAEGLADIKVRLSGVNDVGQVVELETTTDAQGNYNFADLTPSDDAGYSISITAPVGLGDFAENSIQMGSVGGDVMGDVVDVNTVSGVVLPLDSYGVDYNFRKKGSRLEGFSYLDTDDDGLKEPDELGLNGVVVTLTGEDARGESIRVETQTDELGAYQFIGLYAGDYQLEELQPEGYSDGRETAGSVGGTVNNDDFNVEAEFNQITAITLPAAVTGKDYLFGNRIGELLGYVYVDANDNGLRDAGEQGIAGIDVRLTGTTVEGEPIEQALNCEATPRNCVATSDSDGRFIFTGIFPGTYSLEENQNQVNQLQDAEGNFLYTDGKETAGIAGGSVNNDYFGSQAAYNTIGSIEITEAGLLENKGRIDGYLFGERPRDADTANLPLRVRGYVYLDRDFNRIRNEEIEDPLVQTWKVQLHGKLENGDTVLVCELFTNSIGYYQFDDTSCAGQGFPESQDGLPVTGGSSVNGGTFATFEVHFEQRFGLSPIAQSGGNAGEVTITEDGSHIVGIELHRGDDIAEQNLPLDPGGVVYDAVSRKPVANAVVTLLNQGNAVSASCLVGGNPVVTGEDGYYQFSLLNDSACPNSGTYTLQVEGPANYVQGVSSMIPPELDGFTPPMTGAHAMQPQITAPKGEQDTTYHLDLHLSVTGNPATTSATVVNNHIPIDPASEGSVQVIKTTSKVNVSRGELVPYKITVQSQLSSNAIMVRIEDRLPAGFQYVRESARVDGIAEEPELEGRVLRWSQRTLQPNVPIVIELLLVVGSNVSFDEHVNQAWAKDGTLVNILSNIGEATVRVIPDPIFDCSDIIGRVFDDKNRDGYQNEGELGLPGVRVVTPRGEAITSDAHGRFHMACADIPNLQRGGNYILKVDERTLPSGYRVITENPRVVRITQGRMTRVNFGASIHRVVRFDIAQEVFADNGDILPEYQEQLEQMIELLREEASVLRVAYHLRSAEDVDRARANVEKLSEFVSELWDDQGCCYELSIEEEIVPMSSDVEVVR